jgi:NAD(P)-dependent dehydrogenase (short-subunit alcohol dehydrogenase family)
MAVNLTAPFFLIQDAATLMRKHGIQGSIVNIQSMSAHGGQPFLSGLLRLKGRAGDADEERRLRAAIRPHPRQRPEHRLDGDAGRGRNHAPAP